MVILYSLSYDNFSPADRKHTNYRLNPKYYWFTLKGLALNLKRMPLAPVRVREGGSVGNKIRRRGQKQVVKEQLNFEYNYA